MDAGAYKDFIYGKRANLLASIEKVPISKALKAVLVSSSVRRRR